MAEPTSLEVGLLGGFKVAVDGRPVPEQTWHRSKAAALVKLLALAPAHRLHREQAMEILWPGLGPDAAAANLRKAIHYARRTAGTDGAIASTRGVLSLPASVDVDAFRAATAQARRTGDPAAYEGAAELYGDGLLPEDRYDEWTIPHRDELQADFVAVLQEQAALLEARGDVEGAVRAAARLVAEDPLDESGFVVLIRLNALTGRRGEALRRYEQLRDTLAAELGTEPSPGAQRLYEEIRTGDADEPQLTAELWERVGELRVVAGDTAGAAKAYSRAIDAAGPSVRLHRQSAQAWLMQHDAERAEAHLAAAERLQPDLAERGRLACLRANQAWERGEIDRAQAHAEEAERFALELGDPTDIASAREALAIVSHMRGDWGTGLQHEIERREASPAPLARVFDIHHCIGQYHLYGDGLSDGVEDYARRTLELAERAQAVRAQAFAWCLLGESLLLHGRFEEAAGCLERSCDLHGSLGSRSGALPWQRLAELAVCSGSPDEAAGPLRRASAIATVSPMARHMWGRIYATAAFAHLEQGEPEKAARSVRAAAAAAVRYGDCPSCSALLNPLAAEALTALDDTASASAYAQAAGGVASMFESSAWQAMAESAIASAASANGDAAHAREHFESAAGLYERAHQPYWVGRSRAQAAAI